MLRTVFVRASSLDDPEVIVPAMAVDAGRMASWDQMGASLPSFESMPERGPVGALA